MKTNILKTVGLLAAVVLLAACQTQAAVPAVNQAQPSQQSNASGTVVPGGANGGVAGGNAQNTASGNAQGNATGARAAATAVPTQVVASTTSIAVDGQLALSTPSVLASFETSGKVSVVNVVPGQAVKQGDVLAELDSTTLNNALTTAQNKLDLQQAQIEKSLAPAKQTDIDTAKAALNSAYAAYNALKKGPDANTVDAALRTWNQAKNSLYSTQLSRDTVCHFTDGKGKDAVAEAAARQDSDCKASELSVQQAEISESNAHQKYLDAQLPTAQADLTKAWASVVQAQTNLATTQNGASDLQKQVYDVQLTQAKLAVERAKRNLDEVKLISPCNCVVQAVSLTPGTDASGGITLLDTSILNFQTTNLSEQDVVKLKIGQTATVQLKAFTQTFTGKVGAILPVSSGTKGTLALFTAIINLDATDATVRPGMTGQAQINPK